MSNTVDHLRHIARDPIGHHGLYNRTPEALQVIEATNAQQIIADEYAESLKSLIAFGGPLVAIAIFAIVVFATDPIGSLAKWRWEADHAEATR